MVVARLPTFAVTCPGNCNGHGRCMSLEEAGPAVDDTRLLYENTYDTPWDANIVFGCVCDMGYTGFDCSRR